MHGVIDRAHARSVSSEFVILTVRMRTVESRKSVNDCARARPNITQMLSTVRGHSQ